MYEKMGPSTDDSGQESLNSLEGYRKFQPMHNVYFVSSEDSGESNALISREFKLSWAMVSAELIASTNFLLLTFVDSHLLSEGEKTFVRNRKQR